MTASLRLQLLRELVRQLNADRTPDIPEATARRWAPGDEVLLPTISCWVSAETIRRGPRSARLGGPEDRSLRIAVQAINTTGDAEQAEEVMDPLLRHIEARLGNTVLGDAAHSVIIDRFVWEVIRGEALWCVVTCECLIEYQTTRGNSSRAQ